MTTHVFEVRHKKFKKPLVVRCLHSKEAAEIAMRVMDEDNANNCFKRAAPIHAEIFNEDDWLNE